MSILSFEDFCQTVHGHKPFPWQVRAAHRLAARETFPVTVPTGLGKSTMLDAAVWAAAQGTWRRIAFVVDRRIVVDAVHDRAVRIAERLHDTDDPRLRRLANAVGEIQVVRLRGGVHGDDDWVLYPERLTIMLTTVNQFGSRLLFRGYGVSPRRWSMHAGIVGSDSLVIVDEAHLSEPFIQTLSVAQGYGANIALVPMSATLGNDQDDAVSLGTDDLALPVVQQRLNATKWARLVRCETGEAAFTKATVGAAIELLDLPEVKCLAVIVNRVASARRIHQQLCKSGIEAHLLTGRVRAADRDERLTKLLQRVSTGRTRDTEQPPLVVVSTQTIEVGADLDFDALVSECAPLSSLRQRFGQLDRLGVQVQSCAIIVVRPGKDVADPIYGNALQETSDWLQEHVDASTHQIDFGLSAMTQLLAKSPPPAQPPTHAASLLPSHMHVLAQTGRFAPPVNLGAWLHGPTDQAPDVGLIWRADLNPDAPDEWGQAIELLPPMQRESLAIPAVAARRWLCGEKSLDNWGDAGSSSDDESLPTPAAESRLVLRWRGPGDCEVISAKQIRPGDTLVLPCAYGGCDEWGWAPDSTLPVIDVADACQLERLNAGFARRVTLRLTDGHWSSFKNDAGELQSHVRRLLELEGEASTSEDDLDEDIENARDAVISGVEASEHPLASALLRMSIEHHPRGIVVRSAGVEEVEDVIEAGRPVALEVHHADVARWARRLAESDPQLERIVDAAAVHDAGKADERMQAMLHGSALRAAGAPPLAKSTLARREQQTAAWRASGMPRGFRHEFASLDFEQIDDTLTRWLVASHHGHGRPWLAPCKDPLAAGARYAALDGHWPQVFDQVLAEHGPWAIARMEWLLRAADARASIEEAQQATEPTHAK